MALSNKKHHAFVSELFLCGMKQAEAYQRVYPDASYDTARANSSRLLTNANIQAEIRRRLDEKKLSADEVLARLGDMARGDIADFIGIETPSDLLNEEYRGKTHVIKKVKRHVTTTRNKDGGEVVNEYTELEMYSALDALDKVARSYGLFVDRQEITGADDGPVVVKVLKGVSTDDL